ncbi:MAG: cupin domain-containing protein [Burkholderiales bacterium]|nr:cupin domain-containing protein [Burkholderiales bacterium]
MNHAAARAHPTITVGRIEIRYLQEADAGRDIGCFEMTVPPGANVPPPHSHPANEELVYVLEGVLRYTVGSDTRDLHPGECMSTPRGEVHGFDNPHPQAVRALVINTPGIESRYFREVAAIIDRGGPPDKAALAATMRKFGLLPAAAPG